ncbi:MAG: hypothetical protein QY323_03515 [Patescibacteria group bacterium]|nr:MAG: hypothetical protein QY323_03515 [Patescibacteria group bacterium]
MQRFAVWIFTGWARPALFLLSLLVVFQLLWTHVSQGWAACFGMMSLTLFCFLKVIDRNERVTETEREARRLATRARRKRNTAFWRMRLEAKRAEDAAAQERKPRS